ncbi:MAG: tetraether lipid synthase Tes [Candidatus Hydrothermarchaeales archaeon]
MQSAKEGCVMATNSLCPECLKRVRAEIFEEDNKIMIKKACPEHGEFKDIYWGDARIYHRFMKFIDNGRRLEDPITEEKLSCPFDCGLCPNHKSTTVLANIDVTNRCNQRCPICFANAAVQGYVYEPSLEQIRKMMLVLRNEKPVPCSSVQFSGGEPTMRRDLPEMIEMARALGFTHIQIATNGVKIAKSVEYIKILKDAGLSTVYLQFDAVTERPYIEARGYNCLLKKLKAIENCRKAGMDSVVLVPTLVKGINDDQIGGIINFAVENRDVVKGVNFQPVSFAGRVESRDLDNMRITIPDLLKLIEKQTEGRIRVEDFYPVPSVDSISRFISAWKGEAKSLLSTHPLCGAATYVFIDEEDGREKLIPLPRFVKIDRVLELAGELAEDVEKNKTLGKAEGFAKFSKEFMKLIDIKKLPRSIDVPRLILNVVKKGNREGLVEFSKKTLFIGTMHFQDPYNIDCDRVSRCVIHYATPDGRVIPFCSYNILHRRKVEEKFAKAITSPSLKALSSTAS